MRRTMPSISPAKPKTKPDWIAARRRAADRVLAARPRSIRGMRGRPFDQGLERDLEARADRAAEVLAVGGDRRRS